MKQTVVGAAELEAKFGQLLKAFKPPQVASIMLRGAQAIAEVIKDHILSQDLVESGDMYNAVKAEKQNQFSAAVSVNVPYAAVHEYGLKNQVATARQIRFFWAMWRSTRDGMWKALALKGSYTIPARPYYRPAIDEGKDEALNAVMREAASVLTRIAGVGGH